jgi:hypothetical protein
MIHGHMGQLKERTARRKRTDAELVTRRAELPVELSTQLTSQRSTALNKLRESMHVTVVLAWIAGRN